MLVKCKGCGILIDRSTAYKVVHTTKSGAKSNEYYCTETEYSNIKRIKDLKEDIRCMIFEILEHTTLHTQLSKQMKVIYDAYDIENIYAYLKDKKEFLNEVLRKHTFNTERHKINYLTAILKNQINDYKEEVTIDTTSNIPFEFYESTYKPKRKRKCLMDYEREYVEECSLKE